MVAVDSDGIQHDVELSPDHAFVFALTPDELRLGVYVGLIRVFGVRGEEVASIPVGAG